METLSQLRFDNTYRRLPAAFYAPQAPTPVPQPYLVNFNADAAALLDLPPEASTHPDFVRYCSGTALFPGSQPLAMLYAGHQFGHYVPQLGDGRAVLLGELRNRRGEKWDLHLKGAGPTPFSRSGDGRAVLRSTIREYLCSEAMHGLGIPTSRALCMMGSDAPVYRETVETTGLLLRLAPSHVRFGTFEVFYYRQQVEHLATLADYVIAHHFAPLLEAPDRYGRFLTEVVIRTARLIAKWQAVGFAHGVMNTDNMSILGLTLDYGPFGFLDAFDAGFVCNHSDEHGRYAFDQQPRIGFWNLQCLAQTLLPLLSQEEALRALEHYKPTLEEHYSELMHHKLGLHSTLPEDGVLLHNLLTLLQVNHVDYTLFFRTLSTFSPANPASTAALAGLFPKPAACDAWLAHYAARLQLESLRDAERQHAMLRCNPKYVLRNYLAHQAILQATEQDYTEIERLLTVLRCPYNEHPTMQAYAAPPPEWGQHLMVSCSS